MKKKGFSALLRRKEYVIAGAFVVAAVIGTTVVYTNNQEKERQQIEQQLAEEQQEAEQLAKKEPTAEQLAEAEQMARDEHMVDEEPTAQASGIIPPKTSGQAQTKKDAAEQTERLNPSAGISKTEKTEEETTETAAEPGSEAEQQPEQQPESQAVETAAVPEELHFSPEQGIDWPLEGNVILNYSMDGTVHFVTLDQYKYNPAVIIEGEVNDKVCSVARGRITSIENNEVTGCTITVDLGDGYEAIYGQIKEPNFAVGDYVEAGHVIGYVAEPTKYFSLEGSNLYFAMEKDGVPMDPMEFFE